MRPIPILAALLAVAACGPAISDMRDDTVPIERTATFAWGLADGVKARTERDARVDNDSIRARIEKAVERQLIRRGVHWVAPSEADFLMHYHVGVQDRVDTLVSPARCVPGATCNAPRYVWGSYGEPEWTAREVEYVEGRLMLDVMERTSGKLAWRGMAEGEVTKASATSERINWVVELLMERFPIQP